MNEPSAINPNSTGLGLRQTAALVLLHGFTGTPASWAPVLHHLTTPRATALALPGHATDRPVADSFRDNVDQLALEITQLGAAVDLVGYSMGARLALGLLAWHPSLVASATLIGVHSGLRSSDERRQRRTWEQSWADLLRRDGIEAFVDAWEQLPIFAPQNRLAQSVTERQRALRLGHDAEGLARAMEGLGLAQMPDLGPALAETAIPVLLIAGELDTKFVALAQQAAARNPCVGVHLLPRCGHNPLLEAPAELARLLARQPASPRNA